MTTTLTDQTVLLVEDNIAQIRLLKTLLKGTTMLKKIVTVRNGIEAMNYLRQEGEYALANHPDLILLDLSLPKKDGREVLAEIKNDPNLKKIPVLVMTNSKRQEDIHACYDLHANCYLAKSSNIEELCQSFKKIENFWLKTVTLPPQDQQKQSNLFRRQIKALETENMELKQDIQTLKSQLQQVEDKLDLVLQLLQNQSSN